MKTHKYTEIVDGICFKGQFTIENDDDDYDPETGYLLPIITVVSITIDNHVDLMLVIDPRVVQEIEQKLLKDFLWNQ